MGTKHGHKEKHIFFPRVLLIQGQICMLGLWVGTNHGGALLGLGLGSLVRSSQFSDKLGHHTDHPKNLYARTLLLDIICETIMSMCKFLDVIFIPNVVHENLATTPVSFGALANGFVSRNYK